MKVQRRAAQLAGGQLPPNVVRLVVPGKPSARDGRNRRAVFIACLAFSVVVHAVAFFAIPSRDQTEKAAPPPLEVVLVQPPIPLPPPPVQVAPPPPPRAPKETRRREPVRPPAAPAPPVIATREAPTPLSPPLPVPEPREPAPAAPPQRTEAAPAVEAPPAARPVPVTPPSFNAAYLRNPPPRYPLVARRNGDQGTVTLRVVVTRQGTPGSVALEKSSGSASLDNAAMETVKAWRFVPAQQNGQPVEATVLVPIVFRLQDAN